VSASTVAIAGVSGFVGRALADAIAEDHRVIGLGRGNRAPTESVAELRACDLFSLKDAEAGLAGVDYAVYLVHSMMPSATLTQGSFEDYDLVAADNFARAAAKQGVKQIVYLGGLVPEVEHGRPLSRHLASRLEVERALAAYGTPVTALRAGMVVGPSGSSFLMLRRLVERLPVMLTPSWTSTRTQPIDLADVVALLRWCIGRKEVFGQTFDVGGPEVLTYRDMIARLAAKLGKHPRLVSVPFFTPGLSRLWVSLVTGAPKSLVQPLVQSLAHEMVAHDRRLQEQAEIPGRSFDESLERALAVDSRGEPTAYRGAARLSHTKDVRSVQRLPLPEGRSAEWVAEEYMRWLPRILPLVLRVTVSPDRVCRFRLFGVTLLMLAYSAERSSEDRALFYIRGGVLADVRGDRGRFEFRSVPGAQVVIAAIHDFVPRLPWPIYSLTQARVHLWVMHAFGRHLARS
jgi:nucleoside-diphosphate-sugar epimerase